MPPVSAPSIFLPEAIGRGEQQLAETPCAVAGNPDVDQKWPGSLGHCLVPGDNGKDFSMPMSGSVSMVNTVPLEPTVPTTMPITTTSLTGGIAVGGSMPMLLGGSQLCSQPSQEMPSLRSVMSMDNPLSDAYFLSSQEDSKSDRE